MQIVDLDYDNNYPKNNVIALGNFDGLHCGHQKLISEMQTFAKDMNYNSSIFLFKNHSKDTLNPTSNQWNLTLLNDKLDLLSKLRIDIAFLKKFDIPFSQQSPLKFLNYLLKINCRGIFVGNDFKFGYKGTGNKELLIKFCEESGIYLHFTPDFKIDGQLIKSTLIRYLILRGEMTKAAQYLGRYYSIEGEIIHGKKRGRNLGFPTANLKNEAYLLPGEGVYHTVTLLDNKLYNSMTSIGENKTFLEKDKKVETYLDQFQGNLYGKKMKLFFIQFIRKNIRYSSSIDLAKQLKKDLKYINSKDLQTLFDMII